MFQYRLYYLYLTLDLNLDLILDLNWNNERILP